MYNECMIERRGLSSGFDTETAKRPKTGIWLQRVRREQGVRDMYAAEVIEQIKSEEGRAAVTENDEQPLLGSVLRIWYKLMVGGEDRDRRYPHKKPRSHHDTVAPLGWWCVRVFPFAHRAPHRWNLGEEKHSLVASRTFQKHVILKSWKRRRYPDVCVHKSQLGRKHGANCEAHVQDDL
jgi:hypothetical protein